VSEQNIGEYGVCVRCGWGQTEAEYIEICGEAPSDYRNRRRIDGDLYCPDCWHCVMRTRQSLNQILRQDTPKKEARGE